MSKEGMVKIVWIADFANVNIPVPVNGVDVFPFENEVGKPVYELPKNEASRILSARPEQYKLYQTAPIQIFVRQSDHSTKPVWYFPWAFRKVSKEKLDANKQHMRDPDNGEYLYEDQIEWYEDLECKSVAKSEDDAARPDYSALSAQISELGKKVDELKKENEEQEKKIGHFTRVIAQKDAEIAALKIPTKKGSKASTSIAD